MALQEVQLTPSRPEAGAVPTPTPALVPAPMPTLFQVTRYRVRACFRARVRNRAYLGHAAFRSDS